MSNELRTHFQSIIMSKFIDEPAMWANSIFDVNFIENCIIEKIQVSWGSPGLSNNHSITPEFIKKYKDESWDYQSLSINRVITDKLVTELCHKGWDPQLLSCNHSITAQLIHIFPQWNWHFGEKGWSDNPNVDLNHVLSNPKLYDWYCLSRNPAVTPQFVREHPALPWIWDDYGLSSNPSTITDVSFLQEFSERFVWGYHGLSMFVTPEIYDLFPRDPNLINPNTGKRYENFWYWGQGGFSNNVNITEDFIWKHRHKLFIWDILARNPVLTPSLLERLSNDEQFRSKRWNEIKYGPFGLSINPSMTEEYVQQNINHGWSFAIKGLSENWCYGLVLYKMEQYSTPLTFSPKYDPYYYENTVNLLKESRNNPRKMSLEKFVSRFNNMV